MCSQTKYTCSRKDCVGFARQGPPVRCVLAQHTGWLCAPDQWHFRQAKDTDPRSICLNCRRLDARARQRWEAEKKARAEAIAQWEKEKFESLDGRASPPDW